MPKDSMKGSIRFDDVSFSYPTRPDIAVLEDFSLEVPAVRPRSCLKTTISLRTEYTESELRALTARSNGAFDVKFCNS